MDGHHNGVAHTHQRLSSNPWSSFVPHWSVEGYKDPPTDTVILEKAQSGWKRKFPDHPVRLDIRDNPVPFVQGAILGRGGLGVVYETSIDGIAVAWKRTYIRRIAERDLNEINILSQISEKRHEHIINFIGSYTHRQGNLHEIAILTWPVARCDLSVLLRELDLLAAWKSRDQPWDVNDWSATPSIEEKDAYDSLLKLERLEQERSRIFTWHLREKVRTAVAKRLSRAIGCIAEAVNYLHRNGIRHKDIKPSQILLSSEGLWLTDFGMSKDISHLTSSETTGGERATVKYHAPERALWEKCGRAEDVFALGCTYLEVAYRIYEVDARALLNPQGAPMWSFQEDLHSLETWLWPLRENEELQPVVLSNIIQQMMARSPTERLTCEEITVELSLLPQIAESFYGSCCRPGLGRHVRNRVDYNDPGVDGAAENFDFVEQHPFMLRRYLTNDVGSDSHTVPPSDTSPTQGAEEGWFTRDYPSGPNTTDLDDSSMNDFIDDGEVRGQELVEHEVDITEDDAYSTIASTSSMGRNLDGATQSPGNFRRSLANSVASSGRSVELDEDMLHLLQDQGLSEPANTDNMDDLIDKKPSLRGAVQVRVSPWQVLGDNDFSPKTAAQQDQEYWSTTHDIRRVLPHRQRTPRRLSAEFDPSAELELHTPQTDEASRECPESLSPFIFPNRVPPYPSFTGTLREQSSVSTLRAVSSRPKSLYLLYNEQTATQPAARNFRLTQDERDERGRELVENRLRALRGINGGPIVTNHFTRRAVQVAKAANMQAPSDHIARSTPTTDAQGILEAQDEASFSCPYCPVRRFTGQWARRNLQRHIETLHRPDGDSAGRCVCRAAGCNVSFRREDARLIHERRSHPELLDMPPVLRRRAAFGPNIAESRTRLPPT